MECVLTNDCINYVIEHFQKKDYGSVNYLAGSYLELIGVRRPYGKINDMEDHIKKPIVVCKHVISMTMRDLERKGFLKQFSRTSWGKVAPIPENVDVRVRIKLESVIDL